MSQPATSHDERLRVPLWWLVPAAVLVVVLGAELHGGYGGARLWLSYGGVGLVVLAALSTVSRARVRVDGGVLQAGHARLPLAVAGRARTVDRAGVRRLLGPAADPTAYVVHRPWLAGAVQVVLEDPADPTPYWLVSTRSPAALLAAIEDGRAEVGPAAARDAGP